MEEQIKHGTVLTPGHNVDKIDIGAGLKELKACGYDEPETKEVIRYALQRWIRGEEDAAERMAIDKSFHGISFTCWRRVLAAARAAAEYPRPKEKKVKHIPSKSLLIDTGVTLEEIARFKKLDAKGVAGMNNEEVSEWAQLGTRMPRNWDTIVTG